MNRKQAMKSCKEKHEDLKSRVKAARNRLLEKGYRKSKVEFFDEVYGKMLKARSIRIENLWNTYITEVDFTERLEKWEKSKK